MSEQHNIEIHQNRRIWDSKPILRQAYADLYRLICSRLGPCRNGQINAELGSGMGNIKAFLPDCITSDIFPNPWLDRVETAYRLSFDAGSVANLILFDVWHHLEFPRTALGEARRVLSPGGHLILMEPDMGAIGRFVYGNFHHEPLAWNADLTRTMDPSADPMKLPYFACQSSAHRIFVRNEWPELLEGWACLEVKRFSCFVYLASGGFRGRQLYPDRMFPFITRADRLLSCLPSLFAARMLVVLRKESAAG